MLYTTNYKLNKPDGSDVVDVSKLNENMDILDTTIKGLDTGKANTTHAHTKSEISDFAHTHKKVDVTDFAHTHTKSEISDFTHAHTKANITDFAHTHVMNDITNLNLTASNISYSNTADTSLTNVKLALDSLLSTLNSINLIITEINGVI